MYIYNDNNSYSREVHSHKIFITHYISQKIKYHVFVRVDCSISYFCQIHKQLTWQLRYHGGYRRGPLKVRITPIK